MAELPTGTVTFLFTDIEGSTRLVQELGEGYDAIQRAHHEILRRAIGESGGGEIRTEGDSFFAAFPTATGAVRAAVEAQRALASRGWEHGRPLRVRMGMHTGEGRAGGDDYVGIDVNRAARIAAAGHGGQVLVSAATGSLVEHELPEGVTLRDLGTHRLKDIAHPERIFDLAIAGLPSEFDALQTLEVRPNNLPLQLTSFVGRQEQIEEAVRLVGEHRLLTLTGPGGTGKTRLAIAAGSELLPSVRHGAFFVDLSPLLEPDQVCPAVCQAAGVAEEPGTALNDTLLGWLAGKDLLLILDNFEHLLPAAPWVDGLLAAAEGLRVMVTSRTPLGLYGEQEMQIPPLAVPDPERRADLEALGRYEAVSLFVDRARQARSAFRLTEENADAVAEICGRLDGLPLAIELAASRIKVLSPQAIRERLGHSLDLLASSATNIPERQRTLRGAIEWSYDLLEEAERRLVARLSVFAGGAGLEGADAVGNPDGDLGVATIDVLASLVDKSLVRQVETAAGDPRFVMLETIREYAAERLDLDHDAEATRRRHAEHFLELVREAEPHLIGQDQVVWLDRCDREQANIRAALRWAIDTGELERAQEAAGSLWRLWQQRGRLTEARQVFDDVLNHPSGQGRTRARAKALTGAGGIAWWQGDVTALERSYVEALEIEREHGDASGVANAVANMAYVKAAQMDLEGAGRFTDESLAMFREANDERGVAAALGMKAMQDAMTGQMDSLIATVEEVVAIWRRVEDRFHLANDLILLGLAYALARRLADARVAVLEALDLYVEIDSPVGILTCIFALSYGASWEGRHEEAVRLAGSVDSLQEAIGGPPSSWLEPLLGDPIGDARGHLPAEVAAAAWEEGRAMSLEHVVEFVRGAGGEAAETHR
jgi:predicted ATPase/class 3 adenylate cyclase